MRERAVSQRQFLRALEASGASAALGVDCGAFSSEPIAVMCREQAELAKRLAAEVTWESVFKKDREAAESVDCAIITSEEGRASCRDLQAGARMLRAIAKFDAMDRAAVAGVDCAAYLSPDSSGAFSGTLASLTALCEENVQSASSGSTTSPR